LDAVEVGAERAAEFIPTAKVKILFHRS